MNLEDTVRRCKKDRNDGYKMYAEHTQTAFCGLLTLHDGYGKCPYQGETRIVEYSGEKRLVYVCMKKTKII